MENDTNNYLLTYVDCKEQNFAWFDTEEEMMKFIDDNRVSPIEAFFIKDAEQIYFD